MANLKLLGFHSVVAVRRHNTYKLKRVALIQRAENPCRKHLTTLTGHAKYITPETGDQTT